MPRIRPSGKRLSRHLHSNHWPFHRCGKVSLRNPETFQALGLLTALLPFTIAQAGPTVPPLSTTLRTAPAARIGSSPQHASPYKCALTDRLLQPSTPLPISPYNKSPSFPHLCPCPTTRDATVLSGTKPSLLVPSRPRP